MDNKKADIVTTTIEYTYKEGMLEGPTSIKHFTKDKSNLKYYSTDAIYNFHNGRLIGENMIVLNRDTIYCNFGENGKRIDVWKFVDPESVRVI